jgi:glutamate N-acetyltransferase/amino-acid N-acetyltransferase
MTTDTREKSAVVQFRVGGKTVSVAGIIKGAGMIAPSLATMISVVTTDAAISPPLLYKHFKGVTGRTYNAVTVDSDQSTSDTAVCLASGDSGVTITPGSTAEKKFAAALEEVCLALATSMARDGEGATKLITIDVRSAASDADAKAAAMTIANSPLFKCAVHGGDPNWGRIACAAGKSPAKVVAEKMTIRIGPVTVFRRGKPLPFDVKAAEAHLAGEDVSVAVELGLGTGRFTAYTCDLSREYIAINADYHT